MPGAEGETGEITPVTAQYSPFALSLASPATKLAFSTAAPVVGKPIALAGMRRPASATHACCAFDESLFADASNEAARRTHPSTPRTESSLETSILKHPPYD